MEQINHIIENTDSVVQLQVFKMLIDIRIKELNGLNKNEVVRAKQA